MVHTSAYGSPGVHCGVGSAYEDGPDDTIVGVRCADWSGQQVNSRFMVGYRNNAGAWDAGFATGYAKNNGPDIASRNSWSTSGIQPQFVRHGIGDYTFRFPGLTDGTKPANIQLTSDRSGIHCMVAGWTTNSTGTYVDVGCVDANSAVDDTNVYVSYSEEGILGRGHVYNSNPGPFTTYTPTVNKALCPPSSQKFTITRSGVDNYTVKSPCAASYGERNMVALVTPVESDAICSIIDLDERSAQVRCTESDIPVDTKFMLNFGKHNSINYGGWKQLTGTNLTTAVDAGYGLVCGGGAVAAYAENVLCVLPTTPGSITGVVPAGLDDLPNAPKSVAIDNLGASITDILALGTDNVIRVISGDLALPWGSGGSFMSYTTYAEPIMLGSAATVSLKKIVSVRTTGRATTDIVGLTADNQVRQLTLDGSGNRRWTSASFPVPVGVTWKDISHGVFDLFLLATDGRMYRSRRDTSSAVQLPILPSGYAPIAMSGTVVMTNAGVTATNNYPCSGPVDGDGYYTCAGAEHRFYRLLGDNTWVQAGSVPLPTTDDPVVPSVGDPFASVAKPTIVDAQLFEGNLGAFLAWQRNSRIYHWQQ